MQSMSGSLTKSKDYGLCARCKTSLDKTNAVLVKGTGSIPSEYWCVSCDDDVWGDF